MLHFSLLLFPTLAWSASLGNGTYGGILKVREFSERSLRFSINEANQRSGNLCSLDGLAQKRGDLYVFSTDEKAEVGKTCTIRLKFDPARGGVDIRFADEAEACRSYCGESMSFSEGFQKLDDPTCAPATVRKQLESYRKLGRNGKFSKAAEQAVQLLKLCGESLAQDRAKVGEIESDLSLYALKQKRKKACLEHAEAGKQAVSPSEGHSLKPLEEELSDLTETQPRFYELRTRIKLWKQIDHNERACRKLPD